MRLITMIPFALPLLIPAGPSVAGADPVSACLDLPSNAEQRQCAEKLAGAAAVEMDEILRRALANPANSQERAAAISKSQSAWIAYRDAECWGVVGSGDSSGRMTWAFGCLAEKTLQRINELKVPFYQR